MKSAVHKIIRVLQKYCTGCGMDLAAMLSTGLKEAFRGCDQESAHLFHCMILVFIIPLYVHVLTYVTNHLSSFTI